MGPRWSATRPRSASTIGWALMRCTGMGSDSSIDIAALPLSLEAGVAANPLEGRQRFAVHLQSWLGTPAGQAHVDRELRFAAPVRRRA